MRTFGKFLGRALLAFLLAVVVFGIWKREELIRVWAVITVFEEDQIVGNFSTMNASFLTAPIPRGALPPSELPKGEEMALPDDAALWLKDRTITSLLVVKEGVIRFEDYYLGTGEDDLRISWSIAKSYLSALFGTLVADGTFESLDDPVTKYAPKLVGTAYDGSTIRNVLNMASGVTFDEDYLDFHSDIQRMGRVIALGQALDDFTSDLQETFVAPGEKWTYVSIDTHVLGMVIRGATGRTVIDLLSERIIAPLGLEREPYYITDGAGVAFVLGGLNMTTRDFARFGLMIEQNGTYGGTEVVPASWITESTAPSAPTEPGKIGYGYQWWIPIGAEEGEFMGRGIYGQYLYIDQARNVVIVITAADLQFREDGIDAGNVDMMRKIARSL